ncbi:M16 family metallopeptidase [Marinithermus hydrothermalis]|uniref:Peptidase M16 domain protein n=1 Tax=Marinithermus hydrothermalis (strain DSM 14884 / JCM 11576 / T1) TaxID=869210 RepID=F2NKJ6_MARHT|nr:pitrilysin family protein [Marinithermus hydrothermalis]AEB12656.1 peptidase M16 domain protein [Marinithermus hydrothermalis DSM 14884]
MTARTLKAAALAVALAVPALAAPPGVPPDWPDPFAMRFDPIAFTPPEPQRFELPNGIVVYLLEDHTLPLVEGVAYVRASSLLDPPDKVGLAALTADQMRAGGAGDRAPAALDEALEFLAATVEASANPFFAEVRFNTLSDQLPEVLEIFADVLMRPRFDPERLEVARGRMLEAIRRQNDDPVQLAVREFFKRLASGHPAGNTPTEATVQAITRADLVAFHERFYKPNATILALSGDFDSEAVLDALEATFADWKPAAIEYPEIPPFNPRPQPKVYHVPKQLAQSVILIGHPSVYAYTPAYNVLDVANGILGGSGFSSRIVTEIRTKRGLAYATGSSLTQGFTFPGFFFAFSISRADRTGEVIELMLQEIRRIREEGVSAEELERQRSIILNRAVFRFTSPHAVAQRTARAELLGLEPGYYERYLERVQTVTPEEVQAVAQAELRPEEVIILVVGDAALFDRPLEAFGEVEVIQPDE